MFVVGPQIIITTIHQGRMSGAKYACVCHILSSLVRRYPIYYLRTHTATHICSKYHDKNYLIVRNEMGRWRGQDDNRVDAILELVFCVYVFESSLRESAIKLSHIFSRQPSVDECPNQWVIVTNTEWICVRRNSKHKKGSTTPRACVVQHLLRIYGFRFYCIFIVITWI